MEQIYGRTKSILARPTPFCAGCSHGLIVKSCAEVIDEMDIAGRISWGGSAGCTGFSSFITEFDSFNSPHGRSPTEATGLKRCNPHSVVVLYQGDGDAASIGLGDTLHAANRGEAFTVLCANNCIYGMTGGQASATTPVGAVTKTTLSGCEVPPIKLAEMIAMLERPAFVARCSVHTPAAVADFKRCFKKALDYQMKYNAYAYIEVLATCVTGSKVNPRKIREHIERNVIPVFPLGIFKDTYGD